MTYSPLQVSIGILFGVQGCKFSIQMLDHFVAAVVSATFDYGIRYFVPQHILQVKDDLDGVMRRYDGNQIKHGSAVRLEFVNRIGDLLKLFLLKSPPIPNDLLDLLLWVRWTRLLFLWKTNNARPLC